MSVRLTFAVLVAALLSACGQTGPLYLPDRVGEVVTRPAGETPPPEGGAAGQPQSPETAPQPGTQPPQTPTDKPEKKPPP
jgi:predicted small lipoprotein YifL